MCLAHRLKLEKCNVIDSETKTLTICQPSVNRLDPHVWTDDKDRLSVRAALYEALVRYDPGGRFESVLAESWHLASDAQTWTFAVRPDVRLHDGSLLDAGTVVASLDRARGPGVGGELGTAGLYQGYLGAAEITAADRRTVQIVTREPMADLLDVLVEIPIVGQDAGVGTGPYRAEDKSVSVLTMAAFDRYWGPAPSVTQLRWVAQADEAQRVSGLLAGEFDLVSEISAQGVEVIGAAEGCEVVSHASKWAMIFMCNCSRGVCADRRVRQALNYGLDVPEVIAAVKGGAAHPLNGPLTPLHFGYDPTTAPYAYDPELARTLLADAGFAAGMELVLDVPDRIPDEAPVLAEVMAEQYRRIGIQTEIRIHRDRPNYAEMVKAKQLHDAACFDSSPLSTYRILREKVHSGIAGAWWQGYRNPEVDGLLDSAAATVSEHARAAQYRQAYRLIRDDAPWIFLYSPILSWGVGPRANGFAPTVDSLISFC